MKKILLVFSLFATVTQLQAQGFRIGAKGAANTTWLLNSNVFDADKSIDHEASFGANIGVSATYMFNSYLGLSLDVMYASVNQHYKGETNILGSNFGYKIKEKLRYIDLPLLLKLTSEKGPYFEIGPKFSILSNHREEMNYDDDVLGGLGSGASYKGDFNSLVLSIALGFGVDIKVAENMYVTAGLRLAYGPGDTLDKMSESELGTDDHSMISHFSSYENGGTGNNPKYSYKKTHTATGGLLIGYTYEFGGK